MIYICGDSFAVPDPDYGTCWVDLLSEKLKVNNLAVLGASNSIISMQVDRAIKENAEFIIVLFTSSTRTEIKFNNTIRSYSLHNLDSLIPFSKQQINILKDYINEFFDLDIAVYNNKCIIERVLYKLRDSGIPFIFDQGGFEHKSFGTSSVYFENFNRHKSKLNLWDNVPNRSFRPYYHINDNKRHQQIFEYFYECIKTKNCNIP